MTKSSQNLKELDNISLKLCRLKDISELLEDYYFTNFTGKEYSKGDTLITILVEKINDLEVSLENYMKN